MNLSKILILLFLTSSLLIHNTNGRAQNIGINTSGAVPNSSSLLDIDAAPGNNKGLLIPRMALVSSTDATTITNPATSLLVYHTGSGGLPIAGYYYNSGTSGSPVWVQLLNGGSPGTAWMLTGNTGTTGGPHFLGTKDNISLRFRTNNTQRFIIDSLGNVGIGILSPASKLTIASAGFNGFEDIDGNAEVHIGTQLAAPNTLGEKARLAIQPYGHTGGPFNIIARDISGFAFLDFRYGLLTEPTLLTLRNDGNVGIGTASPGAKLEVKAGAEAQTAAATAIKIWGPNSPGNSNSAQDLQWGFAAAGSARIRAYRGGSWDTYLQFLTNAVAKGGDTAQVRMTIYENGNVGIGTELPTVKTHIYNNVDGTFTGLAIDNRKTYGAGTGTNEISRLILSLSEAAIPDPLNRVMGYISAGTESETSSANSFMAFGTRITGAETEKVRIISNGNVGIGTTAPAAKLDVVASTNALLTDVTQSVSNSGILLTADITNTFHNSGIFWRSANNNPTKPKAGIWMYNENGPGSWLLFGTSNSYITGITNTALAIAPTGNIGIGTTTPGFKLVIDNGTSADASLVLQNSIADGSNIRFKNSATNVFNIDQIETPNARLRIFTENGPSGNVERMTIQESGNVGIGSTAPLSKLQVNGDLATQSGQVKRDFLTWNTTNNANVMIHIKTNITISNIMYRILIEGYNYGTAKPINSEAVGYAYTGTGTIISNQNIDHSGGVISSQYLSSDGFVVIRLNPNGSNYYIGFSVSGWFVNPAGTAFNISGAVFHQNADL
ncbi:MAG: hypothetical protein V4511_08930 [Bacteroidota bacterium]